MFLATKKRHYLKEVTILVPKTWTGSYTAAVKETFQMGNIIIDKVNNAVGHAPYVSRFTKADCGDPGLYMHLTPEYVINGFTDSFGQPGRI